PQPRTLGLSFLADSPRPFLDPHHRRARRVLDLHPALRSARAVGQIAPLAHDAFEAEAAGVIEDHRAVAVQVLVEVNAAGRERVAEHFLGLAGFAIYVPRFREWRRINGRKIEHRSLLFSGYAFITIELQWHL